MLELIAKLRDGRGMHGDLDNDKLNRVELNPRAMAYDGICQIFTPQVKHMFVNILWLLGPAVLPVLPVRLFFCDIATTWHNVVPPTYKLGHVNPIKWSFHLSP